MQEEKLVFVFFSERLKRNKRLFEELKRGYLLKINEKRNGNDKRICKLEGGRNMNRVARRGRGTGSVEDAGQVGDLCS
jgi:hypothetical protein